MSRVLWTVSLLCCWWVVAESRPDAKLALGQQRRVQGESREQSLGLHLELCHFSSSIFKFVPLIQLDIHEEVELFDCKVPVHG